MLVENIDKIMPVLISLLGIAYALLFANEVKEVMEEEDEQ